MESLFWNVDGKSDKSWSALMTHSNQTKHVIARLASELNALDLQELVCYQLINHPSADRLLLGVVSLLGCEDVRVSANAAFILTSLCDTEGGQMPILNVLFGNVGEISTCGILSSVNKLLHVDVDENVLNATGLVAAIAHTENGRLWLLRSFDFDDTVTACFQLLMCDNVCVAYNAALLLARLSIREEGCARMLNQRQCLRNLNSLILSLLREDGALSLKANIAFVLAQLFGLLSGSHNLLKLKRSDQMIEKLSDALCCDDVQCSKSVCYALDSLLNNDEGYFRVLSHNSCKQLLLNVVKLCTIHEDFQIGLFAVEILKTFLRRDAGCLYLRDDKVFRERLKLVHSLDEVRPDVSSEIEFILDMIATLPKPEAPQVIVDSATSAIVSWQQFQPKNQLQVRYHLYQDGVDIYSGKDLHVRATSLRPLSTYTFHVCMSSEGYWSEPSDSVRVDTPESVPSSPLNFRLMGRSTSQLKVGWNPPSESNGILLGYCLTLVEKATRIELADLCYIFNNLQPGIEYHFEVCGVTQKGRGEVASLACSTASLGDNAPAPPVLHSRGRTEILVEWEPPALPLGRLNYYELKANGEVIYTGVNRSYTVARLKPNTEYSFSVAAWTSEGRCESALSKAKTGKSTVEVLRRALASRRSRSKGKSPDRGKQPVDQDRKDKSPAADHLRHSPLIARGESSVCSSEAPGKPVTAVSIVLPSAAEELCREFSRQLQVSPSVDKEAVCCQPATRQISPVQDVVTTASQSHFDAKEPAGSCTCQI